MLFFFDAQKLRALADRYRDTYHNARPFPHIVIDNFLPQDVAELLSKEFPAPSQIKWKDKTHEHSKKLACNDETRMPPFIRHVLSQFNSASFVAFLEESTAIPHLIVDPHYDGGGMHQIEPGGFLHIHADFNRHPTLPLDRRLNFLLYLNKNWREEYGGALELWDSTMTRCEARILPLFNRCVLFSTTETSFHGHPHPLSCPPGMTRKSLALYYYSNGRPASEISISHSTLYRKKSGERWRMSIKYIVKKIVPPIVWDIASYARRKIS